MVFDRLVRNRRIKRAPQAKVPLRLKRSAGAEMSQDKPQPSYSEKARTFRGRAEQYRAIARGLPDSPEVPSLLQQADDWDRLAADAERLARQKRDPGAEDL
jgi:hypothetical protein